MELEQKTARITFKAEGDTGEFTAEFATLGVIDHDGDVTEEGAFEEGAQVIVGAYAHASARSDAPPVGQGTISVEGDKAVIHGKFWTDLPHVLPTYEAAKRLGELQEWSYVYIPEEASFGEFEGQTVRFLKRLFVKSVDPVLLGAGQGTRTTSIKSLGALGLEAHLDGFDEAAESLVRRVKERAAVRGKEGRVLSQANIERLTSIAGSLRTASGELSDLVAKAEPKQADDHAALALEVEFEKARQNLRRFGRIEE